VKNLKLLFFILFQLLLVFNNSAQKVGLVLSGGGALGLSHIGVIKALEENNIPIDYITGTSAGALVGGLYSSGYTPLEMKHLVESDLFLQMAFGNKEQKLDFFYRNEDTDASLLKIWFEKKFSISKAIPISFTNAALLDYQFMTLFSATSKKANYNFNNLFVPFRCVAADVSTKKSVVFEKGHLNQAIRASMTYPGYLRPIKVDGKLMFDGGLYNNFPSDVMYNDFFPDIIIGVNLSDSTEVLDQDDILSQLRSMVVNRSDLSLMCENGVLITPKMKIGTFDFDKAKEAIQEGYNATILQMDEIKLLIKRRSDSIVLLKNRQQFKTSITASKINSISIKGVNSNQASYIKKALIHKNEIDIDFKTLRRRFFKLLADEKIDALYPLAKYNNESKKYELEITVVPKKQYAIKFGGVFSSRPINTGYFGLEYLKLGKIGIKLNSDIYFGKFYGSTALGVKLDFNTRVPFYIKGFGVLNNWDYFKSFTTFFDAVKPSYIIQNEMFSGIELGIPIGLQSKLALSSSIGRNKDQYYQSSNFSASDTADVTLFTGQSSSLDFTSSTLNRKQYSSKGHYFKLSAKYTSGIEDNYPGNTSSTQDFIINRSHSEYRLASKAEKYFSIHKNLKLAIVAEAKKVWTDNFYTNYTSTMLSAPIYQPFPESKTLYFSDYVSHSYTALGAKLIIPILPKIDLRGAVYMYMPNAILEKTVTDDATYNFEVQFEDYRYLASTKLIFHSPIGPLALTVNYYDAKPDIPWSFSINYGYTLFNRRFIKD